jgi:O-antigen ligase
MLAHVFAWLFVFAVPWQDMVVLPGVGTMSKALGIAAVGATGLHVLMHARVRKLTAFHWVLLTYMCWVFLSSFWSIAEPPSIQRKINTYVQILLMMWVLWETTPTAARLSSLLQAYVLGAYVAAGSTVHNYLAGEVIQKAYGRFAATGFDANDLGMLLALALPMAWYLSSTARSGFQRWLNRVYFVVGTLAILLTSSRGAFIATLVALSAVPFTLTQIKTGVKVAGLIIIILAGVSAVWLVPQSSFQRLSTTTTEISEGSMQGRMSIWKSGLAAVPHRAFHGYGPAGWYPAAGAVAGRIRGPHSSYLSILVEEGIIGLLLFLTMFIMVLMRLRTLPTFERRIGLALLGTLAIANTPLNWDVYKASWLVLALLAAWSVVFAQAQPRMGYRPAPRAPLRRPNAPPAPAAVR